MWFKKKVYEKDPFCSKCGCPMEEGAVYVGYAQYDPKTGEGTRMRRNTWTCSKEEDDPYRYHDLLYLGKEYPVKIFSECSNG